MAPTDRERAEHHKYRLSDGTIATSVTTITEFPDMGKSSAFAGAAAKLTREGLNWHQEWAYKGKRGTRIHEHFGPWLRGESVLALPDEQAHLDCLERAMDALDLTLLDHERVVLSNRWRYGGRFDIRAILKDGRTCMLDLKTGKMYMDRHCLQVNAYNYAEGYAIYDERGMLAGVEPFEPCEVTACLYIDPDLWENGYHWQEYPTGPHIHKQFCRLAVAYEGQRELQKHLRMEGS